MVGKQVQLKFQVETVVRTGALRTRLGEKGPEHLRGGGGRRGGT